MVSLPVRPSVKIVHRKIFMLKKILVANRGEIAVRVLRACKELGITTVTVYSEADKNALHTRYADECYEIGNSPATESYLKIDKIIKVAKKSKVQAIHPGYGFLAENTLFVKRCETEGIVFIGPGSNAMQLLGNKIEARKTMNKAGIPVIPGTVKPLSDENEAIKIAEDIGFPVLIKAAAGGGGKGMRVVRTKDKFKRAIKEARSEAGSAFGDSTIYIEKYLESPRHIEFQIIADNRLNVVHLCERECSVQRRYQKMIEEAPSPIMTEDLRKKMGDAAITAVKASKYTNAGTVEFMIDKNRNFYFLEMNTRLQVEHPVTELITGIDIVKEQLHIAAGEHLSIKQKDVNISGVAIECRISAEDPDNNFIPSTGKITELIEPGGPGVRIESGIFEGFEVPIFYDPLIAKLLVWAPTRREAISRMRRALSEYKIRGIKTGIPFHKMVMQNIDFVKGDYDTTFVDKFISAVSIKKKEKVSPQIAAIAGAIGKFMKEEKAIGIKKAHRQEYSKWRLVARQAMLRH